MENKNAIYIVGHMNPDTDSICSAIVYADLKNKITSEKHEAKRAGEINSETEFVLKYFDVPVPEYIKNVRTQVRDIKFRQTEGVERTISLKKAWELMQKDQLVTLPVISRNSMLEGVITVGDIARSYMDVYDSRILTAARTPYKNIIETLEGEMVTGNSKAILIDGKVLIAAANPDLMESYIEKNDIVILGNRYESQLCAIEMGAQCIIICEGAKVSFTITKLAEERECTIICTPHDAYTVARLINQSIPIKFFMKKDGIISFTEEDYIEEIREIMAKKRYRDFPVLKADGRYCGMISRRNLLDARKKRMILVDHNERSQSVSGIEEAEILEVIDHHRLGGLQTMSPVFFRNQPLGCTATIIYQIFQENQIEISPKMAGLLCSAIISDTLIFKSPTCTPMDKMTAEHLARIAEINIPEYAKEMFAAGSRLADKTTAEIFYQDLKTFSIGDMKVAVGQINSMNSEELGVIKQRIRKYINDTFLNHKVSMIFFMLTNILEESTNLLYFGEDADELVADAFKIEQINNPEEGVVLEGVVSRKKQLIPALLTTLQQDVD